MKSTAPLIFTIISVQLYKNKHFHTFTDYHPCLFFYSRCNFVYGTPTMFTDLLSQDLQKYDLSSVEAGERPKDMTPHLMG